MKVVREAMDIPGILGSILLALATAQGMKVLLFKLRHHQHLRLEDAVVTGGMPSARTFRNCGRSLHLYPLDRGVA